MDFVDHMLIINNIVYYNFSILRKPSMNIKFTEIKLLIYIFIEWIYIYKNVKKWRTPAARNIAYVLQESLKIRLLFSKKI